MRRVVFRASVLLMVAMSSAAPRAASAQQGALAAPNNTPLSFGMNTKEVSRALGTTLNYVRGRPGDELYFASPNVKGAALSDRNDALYLQFRRGRLQGWKGDWGIHRPCCQ